ncbi:MAG: DUF4974 domain-containing protein [Prevotella sp.]|nr:DUF4974 domain-containing protein [Prevotella sp.]
MNKTELLLQMMEHPHEYAADEWQQILLDEDCRELYTLMSKTRSAIDAARADEQITDEVIDNEWQQFEAQHPETQHHVSILSYKIAASFIGILMISGIAFATIHMARQSQESKTEKAVRAERVEKPVHTAPADKLTSDTTSVKSVVFDNILFDKMLSEIAEYYHAEVVFQNEEARQLRFYFVWYQDQPLDKVVASLNHFESVNIMMDDKKLIVQ